MRPGAASRMACSSVAWLWLYGDVGDERVVQQAEEEVGRLVAVDQRHSGARDLAVRIVGDGELALDGGEARRAGVRAKSDDLGARPAPTCR